MAARMMMSIRHSEQHSGLMAITLPLCFYWQEQSGFLLFREAVGSALTLYFCDKVGRPGHPAATHEELWADIRTPSLNLVSAFTPVWDWLCSFATEAKNGNL
jgi:hypothetical protein